MKGHQLLYCRLSQSACVCAGRLARVGSKSKEEMAKSLAQSSAPGTIPAKGPGRHPIPKHHQHLHPRQHWHPHLNQHSTSINIIFHNNINSSISLDISIKPSAATSIPFVLLQTSHQDVLPPIIEQHVPLL